MLSYVHAYHAGNHADILKHITLSCLLEHLCKKDKPFSLIDTHAGSGIYALHDERLEKTGEALSGIEKIIKAENLPPEIKSLKYFEIISSYYEKGFYPGSPLIENAFLREGDANFLCELHPRAFEELKNTFQERKFQCKENNIFYNEPSIHKRDSFEFLSAVTPPKIKRGLAFIDPSFEDASDFEKCGRSISALHKKWNTAIIALWYPLIPHRTCEIAMMKERISSSVDFMEPKILDIQMEIKHKEEMTGLSSLYGSGMYIVNFPYTLDEKMKEILPYLSKILGESSCEWSVEKIQ